LKCFSTWKYTHKIVFVTPKTKFLNAVTLTPKFRYV